jgi:hypothetical protein
MLLSSGRRRLYHAVREQAGVDARSEWRGKSNTRDWKAAFAGGLAERFLNAVDGVGAIGVRDACRGVDLCNCGFLRPSI